MRSTLIGALCGALTAAAICLASGAHAEPQPAFDRILTERMVRAIEAQARATERLVQATERCHR